MTDNDKKAGSMASNGSIVQKLPGSTIAPVLSVCDDVKRIDPLTRYVLMNLTTKASQELLLNNARLLAMAMIETCAGCGCVVRPNPILAECTDACGICVHGKGYMNDCPYEDSGVEDDEDDD